MCENQTDRRHENSPFETVAQGQRLNGCTHSVGICVNVVPHVLALSLTICTLVMTPTRCVH